MPADPSEPQYVFSGSDEFLFVERGDPNWIPLLDELRGNALLQLGALRAKSSDLLANSTLVDFEKKTSLGDLSGDILAIVHHATETVARIEEIPLRIYLGANCRGELLTTFIMSARPQPRAVYRDYVSGIARDVLSPLAQLARNLCSTKGRLDEQQLRALVNLCLGGVMRTLDDAMHCALQLKKSG